MSHALGEGRGAVASVSQSEDNFCLLTLGDSGTTLTMNGTPDLTMPNCGIAVSSTDDDAMVTNGASVSVTASEICVEDGSTNNGGFNTDPEPTENCNNIPPDPLDGLEQPTPGECTETNFRVNGSNRTVNISPGTYCGGITIVGNNNTVIMEPGDYIIDGGGISVNGGTLTDDGGGVFIFNTSSEGDNYGDISFSGNSTVDLEAQTTGTYAGVLFFQDPEGGSGMDFSVSGTASTALTGTIYSPDHDVIYNGTSSQASSCLQIIALTVTISATSETVDPNDCDDSAVTITSTTRPRLRL